VARKGGLAWFALPRNGIRFSLNMRPWFLVLLFVAWTDSFIVNPRITLLSDKNHDELAKTIHNASSLSDTEPNNKASLYHVMTTRKAWIQTLISFSIFRLALPRLPKIPLSSTALQTVLPLAASSCCLLQVVYNLVFAGCLGINTFLGPWRPLLLGLWLVQVYRLTWKWKLVSAVVALLPEVLHLVRTRQRSVPTFTHESILSVPSMGCVACLTKMQQAVSSANIEWTTGAKEIRVHHSGDIQGIQQKLEAIGFHSTVVAPNTEEPNTDDT